MILTLVVISFTVLALIGSKLGLREFMAVGLLPFVILTMTIERFFVITEEAGVREALRTAAGSAAVATITYGTHPWQFLQLTFFVYPELLFVVAAIQVFLGRYTGYRLSELLRFRKFRKSLMISFKALHWLQELGFLGINRRNADYIMRYNPRSLSRLSTISS